MPGISPMSKFKVNASKTAQYDFVTDQWKKILSSIAWTRQPTLTRKILEPFCLFVSVVPFCGVHEATITISLIGLQEYRNHLWKTGLLKIIPLYGVQCVWHCNACSPFFLIWNPLSQGKGEVSEAVKKYQSFRFELSRSCMLSRLSCPYVLQHLAFHNCFL